MNPMWAWCTKLGQVHRAVPLSRRGLEAADGALASRAPVDPEVLRRSPDDDTAWSSEVVRRWRSTPSAVITSVFRLSCRRTGPIRADWSRRARCTPAPAQPSSASTNAQLERGDPEHATGPERTLGALAVSCNCALADWTVSG